MKREAFRLLLDWKRRTNRKPLILQGARQVGKTWLMREFGRQEFEQTAYFNLESSRELQRLFKQDLDTKRILRGLEILHGSKITGPNTLILLDEIQACPEAISALKYFHENESQLYIIAAGSLLGVAIHQGISFPVGKIEFLDIHPMGFSEYMRAIGQDTLMDALESGDLSILDTFSDRLTQLLREYLFIGGMPEAVGEFAASQDFQKVRTIQENILRAYENDFSKHAPPQQIPRIRMVWQSLVGQLAKENSKFIYSVLRTGARAKEFELAIDWLKDAGLVRKATRISKPGLPLSTYADWSDFKLYLHDTGLLCAMAELSPHVLLQENKLFTEFKGILAEQFILQMIVLHSYGAFYWSPENARSEVDFILQKDQNIIPIEVKSADNLRSRSLRVYYDKYNPPYCIRTSLAGLKDQKWLINIPLYAFELWLTDRIKTQNQ